MTDIITNDEPLTQAKLLRLHRASIAERNGFDRSRVKPFPAEKTDCMLFQERSYPYLYKQQAECIGKDKIDYLGASKDPYPEY